MTTVADLDLPQIDLFDPELRGERFHRTMRELAERSWIVQTPLGFIVLHREAGSFFLRTKQASDVFRAVWGDGPDAHDRSPIALAMGGDVKRDCPRTASGAGSHRQRVAVCAQDDSDAVVERCDGGEQEAVAGAAHVRSDEPDPTRRGAQRRRTPRRG